MIAAVIVLFTVACMHTLEKLLIKNVKSGCQAVHANMSPYVTLSLSVSLAAV